MDYFDEINLRNAAKRRDRIKSELLLLKEGIDEVINHLEDLEVCSYNLYVITNLDKMAGMAEKLLLSAKRNIPYVGAKEVIKALYKKGDPDV